MCVYKYGVYDCCYVCRLAAAASIHTHVYAYIYI